MMRKILSSVAACVVLAGASISVPAVAQDQQLQQLIDQGVKNGNRVSLQGRHFVVTKPVKVPSSLTIDGNNATIDVRNHGTKQAWSSVFDIGNGTGGVKINNVTFNMEHSQWTSGVSINGASNIVVRDSEFTKVNFRAFSVLADSGNVNNVALENNTIDVITKGENNTMSPIFVSAAREKDGYTGRKAEIWSRYVETGQIIKNKYTNSDVRILNNTVDGGYYGVEFSGVTGSKIVGNTLRNNTRNISMQNGSSHNTVTGNELRESISSGIHVAYGSTNNHIRGNNIISHRACGQGMLQAYQGSTGNKFDENRVTIAGAHRPSWLMYVATDSSNTSFSGNIIEGAANRAVVGVESIWDGQSADSNLPAGQTHNQHSLMVNGVTTNEAAEEGEKTTTNYSGGNGPLTNIQITDNTITAHNKDAPVFYVGADVAAAKNIAGNIDGVTITNNTVRGEHGEKLVTHEGSHGDVRATIRGLNH